MSIHLESQRAYGRLHCSCPVPFPHCWCLGCCCCSVSHIWLFGPIWTAACQASLSITISQSLPKFMFIASVMPSSRLVLWRPLLLLPLIFPSIRDFSDESSIHIAWPKYWSFSFSISPSNKYSGLISLKTDWFDLLAVQGIFRSLFQHHSQKISILYGLALTTICDNWEDHSLDYTDLCQKSSVSAFQHTV